MTGIRNALVRVAAAAALSVVTCLGISAISRLPYSEARVTAYDALSMPGGVVAMIGSFVGLYDTPSAPWAAMCIIGNLAFYALIWWLLLKLVVRFRSKVWKT